MRLDTKPHVGASSNVSSGEKLDGLVGNDTEGMRLDETGMAFYKEQLELIKSEVIETRYENLRAREFIPVDNDGDITTELISSYRFTRVGYAKFISEMADDVPRTDIFGEKVSNPCKLLGSSYGYGIFEIARARKAGFSLDSKRAESSAEANRTKIDYIAWYGEPEKGIYGLINHPDTSRLAIADGAGGSALWPNKTPDEVLADLYSVVDTQDDVTFDSMPVTAMLMTKAMFNYINETRIADTLTTTILEQFKKARPSVTKIEGLRQLVGKGENGGDVLIGYNLSNKTLVQRIPEEMYSYSDGLKNKEYVTENLSKVGGVVVHYPQAVTQAEFID